MGHFWLMPEFDALAALVILNEDGEEIARCPDCVLFEGTTIGNKEFSKQDFQEQLADGSFKYRWKVTCKPLEDCTIQDTLQSQSYCKLDLKAIMQAFHKQIKAATKLFLDLV